MGRGPWPRFQPPETRNQGAGAGLWWITRVLSNHFCDTLGHLPLLLGCSSLGLGPFCIAEVISHSPVVEEPPFAGPMLDVWKSQTMGFEALCAFGKLKLEALHFCLRWWEDAPNGFRHGLHCNPCYIGQKSSPNTKGVSFFLAGVSLHHLGTISFCWLLFVWPIQYLSGMWDQGVYPHFCDTRESPPLTGGSSLGLGPFCCIAEVDSISHSPFFFPLYFFGDPVVQ